MKCLNCKNDIKQVYINEFNYDGSDSLRLINITQLNDTDEFILLETDQSWTGYDLTDEERKDTIECPICHKYPFKKDEEIQTREIVEVCCFIK